jgi:hypothetical protein
MLKFLLFFLVALVASVWPVVLLWRRERQLPWGARYALAAFPASFSGAFMDLTPRVLEFGGCSGDFKTLNCPADVNAVVFALIGFGFDQAMVFYLVAFPLSFFFLAKTASKHFEAWASSKD